MFSYPALFVAFAYADHPDFQLFTYQQASLWHFTHAVLQLFIAVLIAISMSVIIPIKEHHKHTCYAFITFLTFLFYYWVQSTHWVLLNQQTQMIVISAVVIIATLWLVRSLSRKPEQHKKDREFNRSKLKISQFSDDIMPLRFQNDIETMSPSETAVLVNTLPEIKKRVKVQLYNQVLHHQHTLPHQHTMTHTAIPSLAEQFALSDEEQLIALSQRNELLLPQRKKSNNQKCQSITLTTTIASKIDYYDNKQEKHATLSAELNTLSLQSATLQVIDFRSAPMQTNNSITLCFSLPMMKTPCIIECRISHVKQIPLSASINRYHYDVQFLNLSNEEQVKLRHFLLIQREKIAAASTKSINTDWHDVIVDRIVEENPWVKSFYLKPSNGHCLSHKAGQFIPIKLAVPEGHQINHLVRCYSLSTATNDQYYRITVKRIVQSDFSLPDGLVSHFLHHQIREGDTLQIKPPAGNFVLNKNTAQPIILIGAGIGITPLLSMLNEALQQETQQAIYLFYGADHSAHLIEEQQLLQLANRHKRFHLYRCLSQARKEDNYEYHERISIDLIKKVLPSLTGHYYLCGPQGMINQCIRDFTQAGIEKHAIHYEAFGPSSPTPEKETHHTQAQQKITLHLAQSELSFKVNPANKTILELAEEVGFSIPSACRTGKCHTCACRLNRGKIRYIEQPNIPTDDAYILPCIAQAESDIDLDC